MKDSPIEIGTDPVLVPLKAVARLTGVRALNLLERSGAEELRMLLDARIVPSCRH